MSTARIHPLLILFALLCASWGVGSSINASAEHRSAAAGITTERLADGSVVIEASPDASIATPSGKQALTIAGPTNDIASLDPALVRDSSASFLVRQIFSGLIRFNDALQPVPDLASRVEISADGLIYSFHLNDAATFQDGSPITANDVADSLSRAVSPKTAGGGLSSLGGPTFLSGIKGFASVSGGSAELLPGIVANGVKDFKIELTEPDSSFLMKLASTPASIVDRRDIQRGADWWRRPNGSGPFVLSEFVAQDHLTLASNHRFYGGAPALASVRVLLGSKALSPFNLYQSGGVDIAGVDLSGIDRVLAPDAGYLNQLRTTPQFSLDFIAFNPSQAPMNDPDIRKALALAFPSARVADVTLNGHAAAAAGIVPDGMLGVNWPANAEPFDPAAAKDAIAHSSYGSADKVPPIRVYLSGGGSAEALRDSVAENVGLKIEVISMEWPDFIAGLSGKSLSGFELYWTADYPDPESILTLLFGTGRPDNYLNYTNPAMDALLKQASEEIDPGKRVELYRQAQQLLIDDHVMIPILFDIGYTLVKPAVKGLTITPMGIISLAPVWMEH